MTLIDLEHPAWYRATNLHERAQRFHAARLPDVASIETDHARKKWQRWRSQRPFQDDRSFRRRLSDDGLSEEQFLILLSEDEEAIKARFPEPPAWLHGIARAFEVPASRDESRLFDRCGKGAFLWLAAPFVRRARHELQKRVRDLAHRHDQLPFDAASIDSLLLASLPERLQWTLARTLILELDIAHRSGLLSGATPEQRFDSFLDRIRQPDILAELLQTYPVLARNLAVRLQHWAEAEAELVERLASDWSAICSVLSPDADPGSLVEVRGGLGDPHRHGRSVHALRFASGLQIIYKPRPLSAAAHFQELLLWLNERGQSPSLQPLKLLDRGAYGWIEYVKARSCSHPEEVRRFYQRQGSYLALLHALGASDMHFENLIAVGEHPMLIDLETIITPRIMSTALGTPMRLTEEVMSTTVLTVGLLPFPDGGELEMSGLGGKEEQLTSRAIPQLEGLGTDELRLVRNRIAMPAGANRPTLGGKPVSPCEHVESLIEGFERTWRLLVEHRAALLHETGPLQRFASDEVRVVMRPTRTYGLLLQESYHPYLLGNALDRDRHFDRLWAEVKAMPDFRRLIPAELEALAIGDIPLFTTRLDSRDLEGGPGHRMRDFFPASGLEQARQRLADLDEDGLFRQVSLIRNTLSVYQLNTADNIESAAVSGAADGPPAVRDELLNTAVAVGEKLVRLAFHGHGSDGEITPATWFRPTSRGGRSWVMDSLSGDLYDGVAGICLFFAHLGELSGEARFTAVARSALATLDILLRHSSSPFQAPGAFSGMGGVIFTLVRLSRLWCEPALLERAEALLDGMPVMIARDRELDISAGVAGSIPCLLALHRHSPQSRALELAIRCGEQLAAAARPMERGAAWAASDSDSALAGFAHGVAGIAWALSALAAATGEERFRVLALRGLEYEQSLFVEEAENWKDLRHLEILHQARNIGDDTFLWAWCHGAPGIGLGRLGMLRYTDDAALRDQALRAVRSTLKQPMGLSHSLCHGDLGNLDLLLVGRDVLADTLGSELTEEIARRAGHVLRDIAVRGFVCGTINGMQSPGLMTGLAGIGYGLLRLAAPHRVPSILLLDGPVAP
jgi:type 2 lantibiotic biosynthesis protein LanM